MNIAFFIHPKSEVAFLFEDFTLRQGLEKMRAHGYTAIPVISRDGKYISTISEGDFLWHMLKGDGEELRAPDLRDIESSLVRQVLRPDRNPSVSITSSVEELVSRSQEQNFVPVVDDTGIFIGIVTRRDIIKYFLDHHPPVAAE